MQTKEKIPDTAAVLTKAVINAVDQLEISEALLSKILGVSHSVVTRMRSGDYLLGEDRKEWELALLFVRVFQSLNSIVGDDRTAGKWLKSENRSLNGRPINLISKIEGLVRVAQYLNASSGLI